jgi:uncharacterized protein involved in exopolysaccharide biosynthesis
VTAHARALAPPSDAGPAPEWTLADLVAVCARRRTWIFASVAFCCAAALLYYLCATPRYRATAVIEVQKQPHGAFGLENATSDAPIAEASDSFEDNLTLQTEIGLLQSDSLALDVIHRTGLEATRDYFAPRPGAFDWLHRLLVGRKPLEPLSVPLADAPNRRYIALKIFANHAKIAPDAGTRLISIGYADPDPHRAAAVVNALIQALADSSSQSRSSDAAQSAAWLQAQLNELKAQTDTLDARAAALDRAAGAYGDDDAHNVTLGRLDDLNGALSAAQSNRIVREAIWRAVQSGNPEVISGLGGNSAAGVNTQNAFALLQSLRAQEAVAQSQVAESADRYGANWPALAEQRAGLATVQKSIQEEVRRLGDRARSDYEVSLQSENSARDAFDQQKALASNLTGNAVALRLARQEAGESRALYTSLLGRLQQTGILEGLHSDNFVVISPALVPPSDHPTSPSFPLPAALALAAGLTVGCAAAVVRELTDDAIHSAADLAFLLETPIFAALPAAQPAPTWVRRFLPAPAHEALALEAAAASDFALPSPESPFVEALYRLRASLLPGRGDPPPQIIVFTRAGGSIPARNAAPHEGYLENESPSLALSFAAILAQHGAPVLYVDADLRAAPPASAFPVSPGLSDVLASDDPPHYDRDHATAPLLTVLHAGPRPPGPSELISSARMSALLARWRGEFAFVVIDGPAAMLADALVLAQRADAVLLAATAGKTRRAEILAAANDLSRQLPESALLGIILEDVPRGGMYAQS